MKVFLLEYHEPYESAYVVAVCTSRNKAKKARKADIAKSRLTGLNGSYWNRAENYSIQEWEVDKKV